MPTALLSDLVDEFVESRKANGYSRSTIANQTSTARRFLLHVGNVQARNVTPRHVDSYFAERERSGVKAGTRNAELVGLRALFKFAIQRRYVPAGADPTIHRRLYRIHKRDRLRVPATQFGRLLDCADHPRDRIVVALGLYLFLRQSEVKALTIEDVDLEGGLLAVHVLKTNDFDHMPISVELDVELRRWLTWYAGQLDRPLRGTDYLVPAKTPNVWKKGGGTHESELVPSRPYRLPHTAVQRVLVRFGEPIRDESGSSLSEGVHTLRRSGARALYDRLVSEGYDGAMRTVQSMLHHSSIQTTEHYLGIHLDKKRRDDVVRGKRLFPTSTENVVGMEKARGQKTGAGHGL